MIVGCEEDGLSTDSQLSGDYIGLTQISKTVNLIHGETGMVEGKVVAAKSFNYDRTLELAIIYESVNNTVAAPLTVPVTTANPDFFTVPTSVTILAGETVATFQVSITAMDLDVQKQIVIAIVPQEGIDIATTYLGQIGTESFETLGARLIIKAKEVCGLNPLRVAIITDPYGTETTWELYDGDLLLIASGGPYVDQTAVGAYPQAPVDICLPNGNYTFVAYDSYGDGMDVGDGEGFYRLTKMSPDFSEVVFEIAKNGTFGATDVVEFSLP
ncbi:hypothetical protein [Flavobacterium sp. SM2513]|uniref:hypothetical protein n=1 Tax=Flavobacterium sp. SM2513 TaxID=3424766 RepID=UPI003D7F3ECF